MNCMCGLVHNFLTQCRTTGHKHYDHDMTKEDAGLGHENR